MIYYKRSERNQRVCEIILRVTTHSRYFWFRVSIILWNLYMCFWWQSLWKKALLSCCLFPPRIKLTQFHNVIIPQLLYNGELRRQSYRAITGGDDIWECHPALCHLLHSEDGEDKPLKCPSSLTFCSLSWECKIIQLASFFRWKQTRVSEVCADIHHVVSILQLSGYELTEGMYK